MLQSRVLKQHRYCIMVHRGQPTMGASGSQELGISGDLWQFVIRELLGGKLLRRVDAATQAEPHDD